jgi:hypothetical protein
MDAWPRRMPSVKLEGRREDMSVAVERCCQAQGRRDEVSNFGTQRVGRRDGCFAVLSISVPSGLHVGQRPPCLIDERSVLSIPTALCLSSNLHSVKLTLCLVVLLSGPRPAVTRTSASVTMPRP